MINVGREITLEQSQLVLISLEIGWCCFVELVCLRIIFRKTETSFYFSVFTSGLFTVFSVLAFFHVFTFSRFHVFTFSRFHVVTFPRFHVFTFSHFTRFLLFSALAFVGFIIIT